MSVPNYVDVIYNPNVKPFTKISLKDIHLITNFINIKVESFKRLPILWKKNCYIYIFKLLSFLTRILIPDYFRLKLNG